MRSRLGSDRGIKGRQSHLVPAAVVVVLNLMCLGRAPANEVQGHLTKVNLTGVTNLAAPYRTNLALRANGWAADPERMSEHVGLLEFWLDVPRAGVFALEGTGLGDFDLLVDGVSANPNNVSLGQGTTRLRLTRNKIDGTFGPISGLRLVRVAADPTPPPPYRPVLPPRPALAPDWKFAWTRKIHLDFHTGAFVQGVGKDFDAEIFADTLVKAHVNSITVFAKDMHGYAYYDTRVGTRHPGLSFDLLGAQVAACKRRGLKVMAYYSVGFDSLYATTQRGKLDVHKNFVRLVPQGAYLQTYVYPMLQEIVRTYDVDGVFIDFSEHVPFFEEARHKLKAMDPGIVVAFNQQWEKPSRVLAGLDNVEIESWEHAQNLYRYTYLSRYLRNIVPQPVMATRFWSTWGDFGGLADEALLMYAAAEGTAAGSGMLIGDQLHPYGRLDEAVYKRVGSTFAAVQALEPYIRGVEPANDVALIHGVPQAVPLLTDGGFAFDVVDADASLGKYGAVFVADPSSVPATSLDALATYANSGGHVFVSGPMDAKTATWPQLLGVELRNDALSFARIPPGWPRTPAFDHYSRVPATLVQTLPGTESLVPLVLPMGANGPHKVSHLYNAPEKEASQYSAVTTRKLGKGDVTYMAYPVFAAYAQHGYTPARQMVQDLFEKIVPSASRRIAATGKNNVELTVTATRKRFVVHAVAASQSRRATSVAFPENRTPQPVLEDRPFVQGLVLSMPAAEVQGGFATLVPQKTKLRLSKVKDRVQVTLPPFEQGAVVVFDRR